MIKSVLAVRQDFEITTKLLEELDFFYLTQDLYSPVKSIFAYNKKDFPLLTRITASDISSAGGADRKRRILKNIDMTRGMIRSSLSSSSRIALNQEGIIKYNPELNFGPFFTVSGDWTQKALNQSLGFK